MNDRDHFAAAALTGLLAASDANLLADDLWADDLCRTAFGWADAMLRERAAGEKHRTWVAQNASLVAAAQAPTKPPTPQADRLTEWERHGSRRWGLGVASDLYDLECRVAALEKANHDAAPAARASVGRPRTDKADLPTRCGTGDTPATQTTACECSTTRDGTSGPVAWAVVSDSTEQIDCEFVFHDENTADDVALEYNGGVVPLYRHPQPTLTDAEREAIASCVADDDAATAYKRADILRGLLERLK